LLLREKSCGGGPVNVEGEESTWIQALVVVEQEESTWRLRGVESDIGRVGEAEPRR
jgi:hypothetical protein